MNYTEIIEEETLRLKKIASEAIQEIVDPIAKIDNPEKIIGKPYAQWTPQDLQTLQGVYVYDIEPLEKFVASKEIDKLFESQELTRQLEG